MNYILKFFLILSILNINFIFNRSIFSPIPKIKNVHLDYFNLKKIDKERLIFIPSVNGFYRSINSVFGAENIIENISTIYHGYPSFELSDLFYDSQMETITINSIIFNINGLVEPNYSINFNGGFILNFDFFKKFENFNSILYIKIPIQRISICNKNGYDSIIVFKKKIINNEFYKNLINRTSEDVLKYVMSGRFKNGYETEWNNFSISGFGNLDLEFNLQKYFMDEFILGNLLFGIVFPTDKNINNLIEENYLTTSLGNNKHFETRLGGQAIFKIFNFLSFSIYGSYNYIFSNKEKLIASFKGAHAFGLQPTWIDAKINWDEIIFSTDLILNPIDFFNLTFGYTGFFKRKDKISDFSNYEIDAAEKVKLIDFKKMSDFSERNSHKLKSSINFYFKNFIFELFSSITIA